jgi:hypothetical protein
MPNNQLLYLPVFLALTGNVFAQTAFTEQPELLPYSTHRGNCMAVTDMNDDGRDDIAVLDNSTFLKVLYQNIDGTFAGYDVQQMSTAEQWGMAVADIDNDGHKDCFSGGNYDGVHYAHITGPGASTVGEADYAALFMQNISIGDINNDGWVDVFGCHDNAAPIIWINDGAGQLHTSPYIDFTTNPASDMSGNYGSVMTDFDNDGDIDIYGAHCRQGVNDPNDPRRWNRLFVNDGNNNYSDLIDTYGLTDHHQSWAVDFGDWDNDGDLDLMVVNHDNAMELFQNDGTGHFTAIGDGGLNITGFLLQCHFEDFDNDGFLDILISGGSQFYLHGNGDGSFTNMLNVFPAPMSMHGFAIGDLNNDGFMDVWANYGSGYTTPNAGMSDKLWLNNGNGNHWLNVRLQGVVSNRDAIGARVTLTTALGTQVREVRSGESYGLTNTAMCHFGLGGNTTVTSMTVRWPSGQVDTYDDLSADQQLTVIEGSCIAPLVSIASSTGSFNICPGGDPMTLTATGGSSYQWDTGESGESLSVSDPGYHTVTVDGGGSCSALASVFVTETPGITPTITADGPTDICWDQSVTLTSSPADGYLWSTGETSQSITLNEPGDYTVTVDGLCPEVSSAPVTVSLLPTPSAPISANVDIPVPGTATLTATGDSIIWYDAASGGTLLGSGTPWTTPYLNSNASFWCAEAAIPTVDSLYGGMESPGTDWHSENDPVFYPIFECYAPFQLRSVLVHATSAGPRLVGLVSMPDGTTINSQSFTLPAGQSRIYLNWDITPGTYGLRMFGSDIGMTYNDVSGTYPYPLGEVGAITSTTNSGSGATAYYEIFYDWEIGVTTYSCEGPRTQVDVLVGPVGIPETAGDPGVILYPVPAHNILNLDLSMLIGTVDAEVLDIAGRTVQGARMEANGIRQLDVSGLSPGEYQLRISGSAGLEMHRFVVQ